MSKRTNKAALAGTVALGCALALAAAGCAPHTGEPAASDWRADNDAAVAGEYVPYDPTAEGEAASGAAIEGSEEEQLQQERIAGGAVGARTSQHLDPLEGVVEYSEGEYTPLYGMAGEAPEIVHGDERGFACTTCHDQGKAGKDLPASHIGQNLTDEECVTCHDMR